MTEFPKRPTDFSPQTSVHGGPFLSGASADPIRCGRAGRAVQPGSQPGVRPGKLERKRFRLSSIAVSSCPKRCPTVGGERASREKSPGGMSAPPLNLFEPIIAEVPVGKFPGYAGESARRSGNQTKGITVKSSPASTPEGAPRGSYGFLTRIRMTQKPRVGEMPTFAVQLNGSNLLVARPRKSRTILRGSRSVANANVAGFESWELLETSTPARGLSNLIIGPPPPVSKPAGAQTAATTNGVCIPAWRATRSADPGMSVSRIDQDETSPKPVRVRVGEGSRLRHAIQRRQGRYPGVGGSPTAPGEALEARVSKLPGAPDELVHVLATTIKAPGRPAEQQAQARLSEEMISDLFRTGRCTRGDRLNPGAPAPHQLWPALILGRLSSPSPSMVGGVAKIKDMEK
jgi:hypothetical protein